MPKIEIALGGRTRNVDKRVADYLVKKGRGSYVTRDLRAAPPTVPVVPVPAAPPTVPVAPVPAATADVAPVETVPVVEVPKSTLSTAEAKARREARKQK